MPDGNIADDVGRGMIEARRSQQAVDNEHSLLLFVQELNRLVGGPGITADQLRLAEAGRPIDGEGHYLDARYLVAAGRVAEQPISGLMRELKLYDITYPLLHRKLKRLEREIRELAG